MRISGHQAGVPVLLPDGTAPLRRDPSDMGRCASAGRVHSDYLQTEEDQRTGISRHPAAGRRTHGRARQGRRAYLPQHPLSELHQRNDQKVGIAGRNP